MVGSFGSLAILLTECSGLNPGSYSGVAFPASSPSFQKKEEEDTVEELCSHDMELC